jgi:hypothetical protein
MGRGLIYAILKIHIASYFMLVLSPLKFEREMIEHKIYWKTVSLHLERVLQMIKISSQYT